MTDEMIGRVVLGRYRIIKPLARGGMGMVYLGRTEGAAGFARPVVIKRILPHLLTDPEMAKMFVREARILSNLHHPGIVGVIDFGEEDSAYVMVLEYVHGYDVGLWRKFLANDGRQMSTQTAVHVMIRVLDALHYAHTLKRPDGTLLKIIHRDISPGNILLDVEGHVRLLDFGIARIANEANEYKTEEATFKGKLAYAPPELLRGQEPSPRSDLYSCAVVLYQLLAGENPFRGKTTPDTLSRVMNHVPRPLSEQLEDIPPMLDVVISKALRKDPAERYQTAAEFADGLREVRGATEAEVQAAMTEAIQEDFHELGVAMGLESLQARDAAWREADNQSGSDRPLRSSRPAPANSSAADADRVRASRPLASDPPTVVHRGAELTSARPEGSSNNRTLAIAIGALALAIAGVAGALALRPQTEAPATPRYLVVTKDTPPEPMTPTPSAASSETNAPTPDATQPASPATTASTAPQPPHPEAPPQTGSERVKPDARRLTQTFTKRQAAVQACFRQNPEQAQKTPAMQIQFNVNESGKVTSSSIIGDGAGTALGQCILGVARGTTFGLLTESVSFRIPVRARAVK